MIRPVTRSAAVLLVALLVAACGSTPPSASPSTSAAPTFAPSPSAGPSASADPSAGSSGDPGADAIYDEIVDQVVALRELDRVEVARETISENDLIAMSTADFDKDNPADYVVASEQLYHALGVMPEDQTLRDTYLELIGSQVAGFYKPDAKTLYVVSRSGVINGADKVTFAHEYVHAQQDQHFGVFEEPEVFRQESDQALARAAIYEGDATLLMQLWVLQGNLTQEELVELAAAGSDPESVAILEATPPILRDTLLFPYTAGQALLQPIHATGGWAAVDAVYDRLPVSTEQILHPAKYDADETPIDSALPDDLAAAMGDGWTLSLEDTWGELQTGIWLRDRGVALTAATAASEGWGGDRVGLLEHADGAWAVVMRTDWDSADDAAEFETAAAEALETAAGPGQVLPGEGGPTRWVVIGSDDATLQLAATAAGLAG